MGSSQDWYADLQAWINRKSPFGEWLYRGQPAKYPAVTPALWRDTHRTLYSNRLHYLDPRVVLDILSLSPVFGPDTLYPGVVSWDVDFARQSFLSYIMKGDEQTKGMIGFPELMASLAQHYGFPTLFVDLSLDPIVSAAFATHQFSDSGYSVSREEGVLYRWPAERVNRGRLQIPVFDSRDLQAALVGVSNTIRPFGETVPDDEYLQALATLMTGQRPPEPKTPIKAVDLSGIHPFLRRPHNQAAVLASPVFLPVRIPTPERLQTPGAAEFFSTPIDNLKFIDMSQLPFCEKFVLPAGVGRELYERTGVTMQALFPDQIDLGYSYLSVMALHSILNSYPVDDHDALIYGEHVVESCRQAWRQSLDVARMILDRECFRLVPGSPVTDLASEYSRDEVLGQLFSQMKAGYQAIQLIDREETRERREKAQNHYRAKAIEELEERSRKLEERLRDTVKPEDPSRWNTMVAGVLPDLNLPLPPLPSSEDTAWIAPEIEERFERVRKIVEWGEMIPPYALDAPTDHEALLDTFSNDSSYARVVQDQTAAQRLWRPIDAAFPAFSTRTDEEKSHGNDA